MFFDLRIDPDERTNAIHERRYRADVDRLAKLLLAQMEKTADPQIGAFELAMSRFRSGAKGRDSSD
jgi:N-sulfoglucosamine sulfohydrolase